MFKHCQIVGVNVDSSTYHAQTAERGTMEFVMSPSHLKKFAECPEEYIVEGRKIAQLRARIENSKDLTERKILRKRLAALEGDSWPKHWGNLVDARLLTPDQFDRRYVVQPDTYLETVLKCPICGSVTESKTCRKCKTDRVETKQEHNWSPRAEACALWEDEQLRAGKQVITKWELEDCDAAIARIMEKPILRKLVECSEKQVQVNGEWHDPVTKLVIPVRCLLDFVPRGDTDFVPDVEPFWPKTLGDMKQCRSAGIRKFSDQVQQFGWHIQASFDLDLLNAATNQERTDWIFLGQKNTGVFQPFKRLLDEDFKTLGRSEYKRLLANYCQCLKHNRWPDADDVLDETLVGCGLASPNPYRAIDAQFAPKYQFDDAEEPEEQAPYVVGEDINV